MSQSSVASSTRCRFTDAEVARDLALEWRDSYLNVVYRSGAIYTTVRLLKSLTAGYTYDPFRGPFDTEPLGVAYFPNDRRTLEEHRVRAPRLRVEYVNGPRLGFVTRARGILWVLAVLLEGWRTLRECDPASNGKSRAMPLLGWILFRHLAESRRNSDMPSTYVVANIAHPLLLGAAFAFARHGVPVDFVEHAMTPRVLMRHLPLTNIYSLSAHTLHHWRAELPETEIRFHGIGTANALQPERQSLPATPRILICANPLDTVDSIRAAMRVSMEMGGDITVRLHDADARLSAIAGLANDFAARLSLASKAPIVSDLRNADLVICGNSNVLMDALRQKRRVLYFWPGDPARFDYYGCVTYYALDAARSESELRSAIAAAIAPSHPPRRSEPAH